MRSVVAIVLLLACAGCGEEPSSVSADAGPLKAAAALECDSAKPWFRGRGDYDSGLESVQKSPEAAFDNLIEEEGFGNRAPVDGYRVARKDADRALLTYDVGGRTKIAVVVADGIRDWDDDVGWGVVAWAQCDPAEYPADVTDALNIGVWSDASGDRQPVRRVHSYQGPEHCDWTDITFLLIGPERRADWYVRDTTGELSDFLKGDFAADATLPPDATDTGWRRSGRELWLGADAAYLVAAGDRDDVERWPEATEPIMCA